MTPEATAREAIDAMLRAAGWDVVDHGRQDFSRPGVAVREFPLATGVADYLLFVDRKAVGAIEAKRAGATLAGVAEQSGKYLVGLPAGIPSAGRPLPFAYESTGTETFFRDTRDPEPRSRRVFWFHRPETLGAWAAEEAPLRARLRALPPLNEAPLRACQVEAIRGLEASLAADRPRALVQMATGAGKTVMALTLLARLVKHARVGRVLFLVDRTNLGRQALPAFESFRTPDTNRLFKELYTVQRLSSGWLDPEAKVVIGTIQRVYSMLRGTELADEAEEGSAFEAPPGLPGGRTADEGYNPDLPPPDVLAAEIVESLRVALGQFESVEEALAD